MKCIHIYRGTSLLVGIKSHTQISPLPLSPYGQLGSPLYSPQDGMYSTLYVSYTYTYIKQLYRRVTVKRGAPRFRVSPRLTVCPGQPPRLTVYTSAHTHTHTHVWQRRRSWGAAAPPPPHENMGGKYRFAPLPQYFRQLEKLIIYM